VHRYFTKKTIMGLGLNARKDRENGERKIQIKQRNERGLKDQES
jgi:hypothetical protein